MKEDMRGKRTVISRRWDTSADAPPLLDAPLSGRSHAGCAHLPAPAQVLAGLRRPVSSQTASIGNMPPIDGTLTVGIKGPIEIKLVH